MKGTRRVRSQRGGGAVRCTNAKLSKLIRTCRNADNIAEIGIGTNSAAKIIGNVLEDEKVHGTCHVAIGDNRAFGGKTIAEVHLDGIIKKPNIFLDGVAVVRDGEFLLGRV